jgi:NADH dehydrogenase
MKNRYKIAITGSNGYIGSFLFRFLQTKDQHVYAMTRKKIEYDHIPFELAGVNDYNRLKEIDILIHCAHDFSKIDYQSNKKINLEGTLDLFNHAKIQGVKKIIFISSLSAFDYASSEYGKLKFEIEQKIKPFEAIIVRPGLVFNEEANGPVGRFIKKSKIIPVVNLKKRTFHPCYLEDLARLLEYLIHNDIVTNAPIIAASEQKLNFKEYVKKLAVFHNRKIITISLPYNLLLIGLKIAEFFKIKLNIRSDSLINMKSYNENLDFSILKKWGIMFRSL